MWWAALLFPCAPDGSPPPTDALHGPATWALQFTPRVAIVDEAVVMELEGSVRLFGGRHALRDRIVEGARELGVRVVAWGPNSMAALAFGRAGVDHDDAERPLPQRLDALSMHTLSAAGPHCTTLAQLGCRTLGDLRRLPRGGVSRRFDKELLTALDRAYGLRPEGHTWIVPPDTFKARLELMSRIELAPALLFGARRLLLQLCGWLAARHAGTTAFALRWAHDAMRPRSAGEGGELTIRTARPMRDIEHLCRLLAEHLTRVELAAPVGDLELEALDVVALEEASASLLADTQHRGESLALVLERIAARLGPEHVLRPVLVDDQRLEWAQHWQPAATALPRERSKATPSPRPTFILPRPLRLAMQGDRPLYQGPLRLLIGPHRIEGGWWHRVAKPDGEAAQHAVRDYWVALSEYAGVLWIFQERLADDRTAWYLHGSFA